MLFKALFKLSLYEIKCILGHFSFWFLKSECTIRKRTKFGPNRPESHQPEMIFHSFFIEFAC